MTANAACLLVSSIRVRFDGMHDLLKTVPAGLFGYFTAARCDVNVVFEPTCREIVGVPESVACLRHVFRDEARWSMTIVANGDGAMARFHPTAELVLHDVTVDAGLSIVGHVRIAAGVNESVSAHTNGQAQRNAEDHTGCDFSIDYHSLSRLTAYADDIPHIETSRCRQD